MVSPFFIFKFKIMNRPRITKIKCSYLLKRTITIHSLENKRVITPTGIVIEKICKLITLKPNYEN